MAYINYENLPSTTTPLTATNLRSMQVEDSGSNARGYWIKYNDGTLIQWNHLLTTDQAINNAYGSLYQGTRDITFPIPFLNDKVSVTCGQFLWGTGASWGTAVLNTNNYVTLRGYDCFSRPTGTDCYISWLAIGKWK